MATSRCLIAAAFLAPCILAPWSDSGIGQVRSEAHLDAAFTASLLGLPIGHITWSVAVREGQYSAAADGSTLGLMRIFAHGHGTAQAHGAVTAKDPIASNFTVNYTSGNSSDEIRIVFNGGRAKETLSRPPHPNPNLVPLTDAYRSGVVDPMTALLIHVPGGSETAGPAACERKVAVFDGHMRYDLQLTFKRLEQVKAETGYQGPAVVCAVYFSPLAGYDPTRYAIKYLSAQKGMEIWLAPLAGTRLVALFRFSVPTPLGTGVLQATRFIWTRPAERASAMNAN